MSEKKIKLGDLVRDEITGYEGVVIGITNWLNGCARMGLQNRDQVNEKTGLPSDTYWVDETTLTLIDEQILKTEQKEKGGPNFAGSRHQDPQQY